MNTARHLSEDMLNAWLDDAITDEERRFVFGHLASCTACREELEALRLVKSLLSEFPEPALPRSFQLTMEQAEQPLPQGSGRPTPLSIRALPIVRALSIAAIFAVLVLGGASVFGPVSNSLTGEEADFTAQSETERAADASEEEAYPPPMGIMPGDVVDQGDSASNSDSAMPALSRSAEPSIPAKEDQGTALKTATITAGIFALIATGMWIALRQTSRS